MSTLASMQWRYATKKFDAEKPLPDEQVRDLLETVGLAPSSFGLQPYRLIRVDDQPTRERISQAAMGQPQITGGSHLIVFAVETRIDAAAVGRFVDRAAVARGVARDALAAREAQIVAAMGKMDQATRIDWAKRQAYLALGVLVGAAAQAGIDLCPMEGFDQAGVDAILGLPEQGLTATVFAVLGHRAGDDPAARVAKVRKPFDQLVLAI